MCPRGAPQKKVSFEYESNFQKKTNGNLGFQ